MLSAEISFIRGIWKGDFLTSNQHFDSIWTSFLKNLQEDKDDSNSLENRYITCKNDLERISVFQNVFNWTPIPEEYFERFQKSESASSNFREAGNIAYKAGDLSNAFRGYNLAIAFAPNESEFLGLGYSNRSALFLSVHDPESALRDITLALRFKNYNPELSEKIAKRKIKCEEELRKGSKEQDSFEEFCNACNNAKEINAEELFSLKSCNENIRNAASFIQVKYDRECGRRLITTKDIPSGTTVLSEEPFVTSLTKILNWDTEHCALCTTPILGGIPCPSCTFGLYCNEKCLEEAFQSVHQYEHKIFSYLHSTKYFHDNDTLLIFRSLSKVGPRQFYKMFLDDNPTNYNSDIKTSTELQNNNEQCKIAGFSAHGVYDSSSYTPVYHLVPHYNPIDFNAFKLRNDEENVKQSGISISPPNEFKALFLTEILNELTEFFKDDAIKNPEPFKTYISSIILRHLSNLQYNILSLGEWTLPNLGPMSQPLWKEKAKTLFRNATNSAYALGVFPLVALCNHSCDPNAIFVKCSRLPKASIVTSRKIRAGDEILISYKQPFNRMDFEDRREYLLTNYKFICNCYACSNGYSAKDIVSDSCGKAICTECQRSEDVTKDCAKCASKMDRVVEVGLRLEEAEELIRKEKFVQAYQIVLKEANFLSEYFQPNYEMFQTSQDLLRRIAVHIMHS